jgi:hypothetical protein
VQCVVERPLLAAGFVVAHDDRVGGRAHQSGLPASRDRGQSYIGQSVPCL